MEISRGALPSTSIHNSPRKYDDLSTNTQKLEQQKKDIQQEIKQLEQSKQGRGTLKGAKENLSKQMKQIDQQIQVLKQQAAAEVQQTEESSKVNPPRFDEYVKNDKESCGAGIYSMEKDENGNPLIVFDSPEKPLKESQESLEPGKAPSEEDEPDNTTCTVNTDKVDAEIKKLTEQRKTIQQKLEQAESPEEKAALQKQLDNIEAQLRAKDNDAYRKQNATYTYSKEG